LSEEKKKKKLAKSVILTHTGLVAVFFKKIQGFFKGFQGSNSWFSRCIIALILKDTEMKNK
jgi:hypothetical protein